MEELLLLVSVFLGSFLIGYLLIRRVPPLLHTPLMSMTNAVSGVTVLGALLLFAVQPGMHEKALGAVALALAAFNVIGGFAITDRMLKMFKDDSAAADSPPSGGTQANGSISGQNRKGG